MCETVVIVRMEVERTKTKPIQMVVLLEAGNTAHTRVISRVKVVNP